MSSQVRALGALRRGALRLRRTPFPHGQNPLRLGSVQAAFPALGAPFSLDNRHFSTSDAVPPTLELTMADGQLTDVAAAVVGSGTVHEPWAVVQGVQSVLETVHTTTGLPWWATLLLSGVTLRAAIFPFYVFQIQAMQRLVRARPDFSKLYSAYKYARTFTPGSDHKGHLDAMLLGRQGVKAVMKKFNTRPIQTVMGSVAYIPIFILMSYSARDMVRSGNFAGFDSGGLLFWKNLMETDSTYTLPILAAVSTYGNLELSARTKSGLWTSLLQWGQYGTILAVPFLATLPQGVFFYWLGSSWSSMAQTVAMNNNDFRRRIGLKPRITETQSPAEAAAAMLGKAPPDATGGAAIVNTATTKSPQQ
ncbi:Cytochrome c oxidase assembly protein cox18, mitochondrial [Phytophthora pseudosyringae]|uniref:Cytochrome c oxidase assembly protein cox18, mitochondrial n=1 Tax=Phytophthora pseudosyringae TaxID=221518 RepID=A0A8T1WD49_9STRA|nr:Cytochrome c oxidase assembly protein cox18, mitochondrial [Phytophthora pseudosyringae]